MTRKTRLERCEDFVEASFRYAAAGISLIALPVIIFLAGWFLYQSIREATK